MKFPCAICTAPCRFGLCDECFAFAPVTDLPLPRVELLPVTRDEESEGA